MKILVIQQKMIGDVLVSSILCNNLKRAYPDAQIDYMVYESTLTVLEGNPYIDNYILFKNEHRNSIFSFFKLILKIRKEKYDLVIDSYSKLESWLTILFLRSSRRISFKKVGRSFLYTDVIEQLEVPKTNLGLIIERRLSLLSPLNLQIDINPVPQLFISTDEMSFAKKLFVKHGIDSSKKTVMMSIIGSSENKTLPLSEMSKIVDFVAEMGDVNILFNYFPKQIKDAKQIYNACNTTTQKHIYFDLFGNSLREFIAIMNQCDLIIGNDGGAINMAKALNKPSFIIFSPWIEKKMWSTFEDGKFNKSIHLNDYKPELFKNKSKKLIKKEAIKLYKKLSLKQFSVALKSFLEYHIKYSQDDLQVNDFVKSCNTEEKLSVLVITLNEIKNVDKLVASVSFADEIIVVDSFSTDGTVEAFEKYKNVKVIQQAFKDFSSQRNFAISKASNNWILFVDADERISDESRLEIKASIKNSHNTVAFGFFRKFIYNGKELNFGGFQSDKVYRLFHKEYASYDSSKLVHESLLIEGKSGLLKNRLTHYSYSNDDAYKNKLTKYGKLRAMELYAKKVKPLFYHFYLKPAYRFFHLYIIRFGFLDGKQGVKMAKLSAFGVKQRYIELKKMHLSK